MRGRNAHEGAWDDRGGSMDSGELYGFDDGYNQSYGQGNGQAYAPLDEDDGPGLVLQPDRSLVNVSASVTHHGAPLLSYAHTMNRFYTSRKQKLSAGRHKCTVCGERIRFWAWETEDGQTVHDGCYERLAWTWTSLYAQQQRLAAEGRLD